MFFAGSLTYSDTLRDTNSFADMERKRPASQSSHLGVTETSQEGTQKRAKLVLKPPQFITASQTKNAPFHSFDSFLESVLELETSDEVLEQLLLFVDVTVATKPHKTVLDNVDSCVAVLKKLWKEYSEDLPICGVLIHVFVLIVNVLEGSLSETVKEFALSLLNHVDFDVKVSALKCLQRIARCDSKEFLAKVLQTALSEIHCPYHKVRVECVNLIGQLSHVTGNLEDSLVILEERCGDADPRVRTAAFQSLCALYMEGFALPLSVYTKASDCLTDDSGDVRTSALRVVWRMGLKYQDRVIPLKEESSVEIRLLDDAFVKICNLVNDSSVTIRALAAGLLGDFHSVSEEFLSQTLDKKLMSHLRVVKSEHERQKELHQKGASMDWETGRKWGGAPKMEIDPGEISLMNAGACGAFVHGLEDEFMEVRSAAIDSMCRLGVCNSKFAGQCLDFLVDMFNDEIQSVRLKSISSLGRIAATMVLRDDQLETVLGILDESSGEIRDALRNLLSTCQITTRGCLNTTVHSLLDNLKKYPTDKQSIWRCLKQLGSHHGNLLSMLVPELLSTHPFFMGKEPDVDDPAYICILILVFNAAAHCPVIPPLFPNHVFRHYTYLRDTLPDLIPHIRTGVPSVMKLGQSRRRQGHSGSKQFVAQVLARAQSAANLCSLKEQQEAWHSCITDLQQVKKLDKAVASSASCAAIFIQCQLLINKVSNVLSQDVLLTSEGSSHQNMPPLLGNIRELLLLGYRLEHTFTNLNSDLLMRAKMVRVTANAMSLILATHMDMDTENSDIYLKMKLCFQDRIKSVQRFCDSTSLPLPSVFTPFFKLDVVTTATETFVQLLQPLIKEGFCTNLPLSDLQQVRQTKSELLAPQSFNSDDHTRFVSSLALSVNVEALLRDVKDRENVAVQVIFPDGQRLLFPVKPSQIRETVQNEIKLETSVVLSHGVWTDPSQLELCIVTRYQTDVTEDSCLHFPSSATTIHSSSSAHQKHPTRPDHSKPGERIKIVEGGCSGHVSANPVHSHQEDGLVDSRSVLVISDTAKINIHPQEKASNSFGAFLDPVNRL